MTKETKGVVMDRGSRARNNSGAPPQGGLLGRESARLRAATRPWDRMPAMRFLLLALRLALLVAAASVVLHLVLPPVYRFPEPRRFSGPSWYNPYEGADAWLRGNFHAHSSAWGGLSYGKYAPDEVRDFYLDRGYDVPVVTNYQQIYRPQSERGIPLTGYEHGFNPGQRHQTVLNSRGVSFFDLPLFQGPRQKQAVLDQLREDGALVILNHPTKADAYSLDDARKHYADAARRKTLAFIRRVAPVDSPEAYTAAELERFNRGRISEARFAPYG